MLSFTTVTAPPNPGHGTLTQAHWHPAAQALMQRCKTNGDSGLEALVVLKLSDVIFAGLQADAAITRELVAV
jgi:predicted negative regulator of RcsB-dependent stress response